MTEQEDVVGLHYSYDQGSLCAISRESAPRDRYNDPAPKSDNNVQWQTYKFPADNFGNTQWIYVSGSDSDTPAVQSTDIQLVAYAYDTRVNNGRLTGMTYGNGYSVSYTYDKFDRVTKQENSDNTEYRYYYNSEGALARQESENTAGALDEVYSFEYDSLGRLIRSRQTKIDSTGTNSAEETVQSTQHMYDEENRITSQSYSIGERTYTENYAYNDNVPSNSSIVKDGSLHSVNYATLNRTATLSYDSLKHLQSVSVPGLYNKAYSYKSVDSHRSTNLISEMEYSANSSSLTGLSFAYTYDDRGNILTVSQGTSSEVSYEYNAQNQLIKEYRGGIETRYTYDTAGNILSIADTLGLYPEKSFTYGNANWRDLLTGVSIGGNIANAKKIYYQGQTYNAATDTVSGAPISGNPLNWYNGTEYTGLTWGKDRQLTAIATDSKTASYAYDMNGIRSSKTVTKASGTEQHSYLTQNGQVVRETIGTGSTAKILDFIYDNNGQPFALCYSNNNGTTFTTFYYVLNLQGDVVRLVNGAGTTYASYEYDAWGNILSQQSYNSNYPYLHQLNPLRYRGYYYDTETGFYYLQSRYYDPNIGRFINADAQIPCESLNADYNLFLYCRANPVFSLDSEGTYTVSVSLEGSILVILGLSRSYSLSWDGNGVMECQYSFSNPTEKRASSFGSFSIFLGLTIQITNKESVADLYGTSTYIGGGRIDLVSIARANDLNDKDVEGIKVQLIGLAIDALDIADIHVSQSWTQKAHYQFPNITTDYPQVLQYNTKQSSNYKLSRHKNTRKKVRTNSCFVYFSY